MSALVCVCQSLREHISRTTRAIFTKVFVHVAYCRGSVNNFVSKAYYARISMLFRWFSTRNITLLRRAYTTYVRHILKCASNVWNPHFLKHVGP